MSHFTWRILVVQTTCTSGFFVFSVRARYRSNSQSTSQIWVYSTICHIETREQLTCYVNTNPLDFITDSKYYASLQLTCSVENLKCVTFLGIFAFSLCMDVVVFHIILGPTPPSRSPKSLTTSLIRF